MIDKIDSWDYTMAASTIAFVASKIAIVAADESMLNMISTLTAILFSLTALVKLVDLVFEKCPKWIATYRSWKKPKDGV
jgi:hypothetical protein